MNSRNDPPVTPEEHVPQERKPRLLDLFCGAGGAARGYQRAGFYVIGVDVEPQPHYVGDEFIQADVLEWWRETDFLDFRAVHASPPCQHYSALAHRNGNGASHPDLIPETRRLLERTGLPWVIENVEGAPLRDPVKLCGTMFPGLRVLRHRLFETSPRWLYQPAHMLPHPLCYTRDKRKANYGRGDEWTDYVHVNGGGNCSVGAAADAMGIDWMTKAELNEAIPPAYTEWVGSRLLEALKVPA